MTKRGKPVAKPKAARKTTTQAKTKPVGANRKSQSTQAKAAAAGDPLDAFVDAAALALELPVEPEWRPAIKANLAVTLHHAALVVEFGLPDEAEPAPVF